MPTIVTTAASVTKLIQEVPNIVADSIVNSVLGNKDITRSFLADTRYGFNHLVANKFYNYGKLEYVNGLPTSQYVQGFPEDVENLVIEAINTHWTGQNPASSLKVVYLSKPKNHYLMYDFFTRSAEWNIWPLIYSFAGILQYDPQIVQEISTGITYVLPPWNSPTFNKGNLHFELTPEPSLHPTLPIRVVDIPFNVNDDTTMLNVLFETNGAYYYWVYAPISGLYKELTFMGSIAVSDEFFPIAPIRLDNDNVVDLVQEGELAASVANLLRRMNIDLKEFSDGLIDPDNPSNLDSTDNAYLMFAISLNSDEDIANHYLYEFFKSLYYTQNKDQQDWLDKVDLLGPDLSISPGSRNLIHIQDQGQDISLWWNFITVEVKDGLIGDTHPAYDPELVIPTGVGIDLYGAGQGNINMSVQIGDEYTGILTQQTYFYNTHVTIFRKQLRTGVGATFVELVVHGLQHSMVVDERSKIIYRTPATMDDGGFFIPISKDVVDLFNPEDESLIYYESMIFLAYAIEETKLEWYQDPAFFEVIQFVGVVLTIVSGGLATALTDGIIAFLQYALEVYFTNMLLEGVLGLGVSLIGIENAVILAAIAATVAIAKGNDATQVLGVISAEDLLSAATLTIRASNKIIQEDAIELRDEAEEFADEMDTAQKDLDRAMELLGNPLNLELYTLLSPERYTDYTESPSNFYNRTVHETNPGVLSLDAIENYASNALALPKPLAN